MVCIFDASALFEVSTGSIMHSETVGRVLGRSFWADNGLSLRAQHARAEHETADIKLRCRNPHLTSTGRSDSGLSPRTMHALLCLVLDGPRICPLRCQIVRVAFHRNVTELQRIIW